MYFTEEIIEKIFEQEIESDNDPVMELENIAADQPALISYLGQENLELLTEEEFDYCAFLVTIIYKTYAQSGLEMAMIEPDQIDAAEELNWEKINASEGKNSNNALILFLKDSHKKIYLPLWKTHSKRMTFPS